MFHSLSENLVIQFIMELQIILTQVIVDILCHSERNLFPILCLDIIIYHLLSMPYYHLCQQSLHLSCLFIHRMQAYKLIGDCSLRVLSSS